MFYKTVSSHQLLPKEGKDDDPMNRRSSDMQEKVIMATGEMNKEPISKSFNGI